MFWELLQVTSRVQDPLKGVILTASSPNKIKMSTARPFRLVRTRQFCLRLLFPLRNVPGHIDATFSVFIRWPTVTPIR